MTSQLTADGSLKFGELAQLGERLVCNQEVTGSSPVFSTKFFSRIKNQTREKLGGAIAPLEVFRAQ